MEDRSKNDAQERDALLKQAFDIIMKLDNEKLRELMKKATSSVNV